MSKNLFALLLLAAALITTVLQVVIYGPQLPATVASHFGQGGAANGSMGKVGFITLMVVLQFGMAAMLVGTGFAMRRLPPALLNIPRKDYWLHEDRRESTFEYNQLMLNWIAALTAILIVVVFQLTIQANLGNANGDRNLNMPVFTVALITYLMGIFAICGQMMIRFSRVPAEH